MKVLEIIQLRSTGRSLDTLSSQIKDSIGDLGDVAEIIKIYRQDGLLTDLAIHIHHRSTEGVTQPSEIGLRLASALSDHGLITHTVWWEMK